MLVIANYLIKVYPPFCVLTIFRHLSKCFRCIFSFNAASNYEVDSRRSILQASKLKHIDLKYLCIHISSDETRGRTRHPEPTFGP